MPGWSASRRSNGALGAERRRAANAHFDGSSARGLLLGNSEAMWPSPPMPSQAKAKCGRLHHPLMRDDPSPGGAQAARQPGQRLTSNTQTTRPHPANRVRGPGRARPARQRRPTRAPPTAPQPFAPRGPPQTVQTPPPPPPRAHPRTHATNPLARPARTAPRAPTNRRRGHARAGSPRARARAHLSQAPAPPQALARLPAQTALPPLGPALPGPAAHLARTHATS